MQVALAWVLATPFPVAPVAGPHTVEDLESFVKDRSLELTPAENRWPNLA